MMDFTMAVSHPDETSALFTLGGRIGASVVETFEKELLAAVRSDKYGAITLDCRDVAYITSSGLRVLLKAIQERKKRKQTPLACICKPDSYFWQMLVMVGFNQWIALRQTL